MFHVRDVTEMNSQVPSKPLLDAENHIYIYIYLVIAVVEFIHTQTLSSQMAWVPADLQQDLVVSPTQNQALGQDAPRAAGRTGCATPLSVARPFR